MSVIKSRIQLGLHHSAAAAVAHARRHGGLYAGFRATIVLDSAYAAVQFTTIEQLRRFALHRTPSGAGEGGPAGMERGRSATDLSTSTNMMIGFATGIVAAVLTEPLDVIRTRLMTQRGLGVKGSAGGVVGQFNYEGLVDGLRRAVRTEGPLALWKGLLPRLLTKATGSLIWYAMYMEARRLYVSFTTRL